MMIDLSYAEHQIHCVTDFQDLVSISFKGEMNAICWTRNLMGDFSEIVKKVELSGNITTIEEEEIRELQLSEQGQLAREILLNDLKLLNAHGASPILNVINYYDRDDSFPFLPTDVYSFHVDRSPIPTDTFYALTMASQATYCQIHRAYRKCLFQKYVLNLKNCIMGRMKILSRS